MKVVAFSDSHGQHEALQRLLPPADTIICAGDVSRRGNAKECTEFIEWYNSLPYKNKIFIAGNHDFFFERNKLTVRSIIGGTSIDYLENSSVIIDGIKFYGSPVTPWFYNWAFNVHRGSDIKQVWDQIDLDTDVLITHGPPMDILDKSENGEHCGCQDLYDVVDRIDPSYHIFGHIHEGYGLRAHVNPQIRKTTYLNASVLDEQYRLRNLPHVFEIASKK